MTTDTEALRCDCAAKEMPFGRCCKLEPLTALRASFEAAVSECGWDIYRNKAGDYATTSTNGAWAGYQAGHAAAKAETAEVGEPVAHAIITTDGVTQWPITDTHAAAEKDLLMYAAEDRKRLRIVPLYTAPQLAAAVEKERERCLRIVESVDNYSNPMTANDCADAIRAGAKEPSDG